MNIGIIKLSGVALLPVILFSVLYLLNRKTKFRALNEPLKQVLIGIAFGLLAVAGTEFGVTYNGATVNCRDASVLTAGLMFGGPAGIIAGLIGGVERWIAVAWGAGSFTRLACSISTAIAGFYAALLRKFLFEGKKPGWLISLAIGLIMETFHLTMVFVTNMSTPIQALAVVNSCTAPMLVLNSVPVMLSSVMLSVLSGEKPEMVKRENVRITQTIQRWLLLTVVAAFVVTTFFVFRLQNRIAAAQTDSLLQMTSADVASDILDASDKNMLELTWKVAEEAYDADLDALAEEYQVAEIYIFDQNGDVTATNTELLDFSLSKKDGDQSYAFWALLDGTAQELVQEYRPMDADPSVYRKFAGVKTDSGFVQVGYDAEEFQKDIDAIVLDITKNRHIGSTGYTLIFDTTHLLVSAPDGFFMDRGSAQALLIRLKEENTTYTATIDQTPVYCSYCKTEGYYIVSILPQEEAMQMRDIALYVNTFLEVLVFAALFMLIYLLIKKVVVNRIKEVNSTLAKITGGDLNETVNVRTNEEFASLSDDINSTVDTLKRYIAEASARIDKELEFAKNIQSSALPNVFPAFPKRKDFDIFATMDPAKEVGGDFYDFYLTHTDTLNFLIADVSGKGIPAAMFMMRAKTELKSLTEADMTLDEVFTKGNEALCEGNDAGMFVTAWQGSADLTTGLVRYANAGHNPPLVRHADGRFEYLRGRPGFVLAGMDGVRYKTGEIQLQPGDIVYLYTDGVTEATNAQEELYGEERLLDAINRVPFTDMRSLCELIRQDVNAFVGDAPQFDDMTMVALHYIGTKAAPSVFLEQAKLKDIPVVTEFVEAELEKLDCPMKTAIQFSIAVDEIFSNIVRYGYPKGPGPVRVEVLHGQEPASVSLRFTDEGIPYNPLKKEDPDVTLSAEERDIGGLGIFMVKKTMDDMKYEYENGKNILTIKKLL